MLKSALFLKFLGSWGLAAREGTPHMPGAPAAGGWGGSNRTLGIEVEGFTQEEVSAALPGPRCSPRRLLLFCSPPCVVESVPRACTAWWWVEELTVLLSAVCCLHVQIAKAVDHCDNDKIKTIKYLNKLKGKVTITP